MSIYFSSHKKKKNFPHWLFGFAALILFTGLCAYLISNGLDLEHAVVLYSFSDMQLASVGFAMAVSSFLLYIFSIGIAREINVKYKSPLYILQFVFFILLGICGYTLDTDFIQYIAPYLFLAGFIYFFIMALYFLIQKRIYSRYFSRIAMAATALPVIPFAFFSFIYLFTGRAAFSSTSALPEIIFSIVLLASLLLYNVINTVYLLYIGRRVY